MQLLTSQKDSLFDLIENSGLSPFQFEFTEVKSKNLFKEIATKLVLKNSNYYFQFETSKDQLNNHFAIFCPGEHVYEGSVYTKTWEIQTQCFKTWLTNLLREINSPNKWDRLDKEISNIEFQFENDETKFTAHEFEDLQQKITALKQGVTAIGLLPEQIALINTKLDQLCELGKQMNKFDWKSLFIGTIISIIIQLSVTPENAKSLWGLIKQIFSNYLLP